MSDIAAANISTVDKDAVGPRLYTVKDLTKEELELVINIFSMRVQEGVFPEQLAIMGSVWSKLTCDLKVVPHPREEAHGQDH